MNDLWGITNTRLENLSEVISPLDKSLLVVVCMNARLLLTRNPFHDAVNRDIHIKNMF